MTKNAAAVLVVDDQEMNRDMLSRRLQRHGYAVAMAENGQRALELISEREFALVLLDIEMPEVSGLDVLKMVRRDHSPVELPIIMVTARQDSGSIVDALGQGANDYVTKPIDFAVAIARIETQLACRRLEAALRESEERYALAVRGANDGLWDWDLRAGEIYFSPRWKAMLGWDEADIGSDPDEWFRRVHPAELEQVKAAIAEHVQGRSSHLEVEHRIRHRNGTFLWVRTRGLAVRDPRGKAHRMAGSQTDVTGGKVADPLTGLPNRVLFTDRLEHALQRTGRHGRDLCALLVLDLDRFKLVNDSLGHAVGDELLVALARRLEGVLRASDTVSRFHAAPTLARLGGDEFTILLDDLRHASDALRVAQRLQEQLVPSFDLGGQEVFVTASIGIAIGGAGHTTAGDFLREADMAMHRAKSLGGARSELFDTEMRDHAVARLQLETDLRRAIDRQEFELYYQPIVSLATGRLFGFEALIRWRHPDRGLVVPADFISVAEETGTIVPIGEWVLQDACRQMSAWLSSAGASPLMTVNVNLSVKQFAQGDLVQAIDRILRETGLPAGRLKLEITESTVMERTEAVIAMLRDLKGVGVQLAIDDFGTGYSSLSYVHRFPVDSLKIDRAFVRDMGPRAEHTEIVRAIVDLAHNLRLDVVAEGVETPEQLAQLRACGCEYGQGFLFSPPLDRDAAGALIAANQQLTVL